MKFLLYLQIKIPNLSENFKILLIEDNQYSAHELNWQHILQFNMYEQDIFKFSKVEHEKVFFYFNFKFLMNHPHQPNKPP